MANEFELKNLEGLKYFLGIEVARSMPKYAKFLKELISSKKKLQEFEAMTFSKECSAIISNKLPLKRKHPGSLTIPCSVGNLEF